MKMLARSRLFAPLFVALTSSAWLALWVWDAGPYARYLRHASWAELPLVGTICREVPGASLTIAALLHSAAWLLMIAAMMLPSAFPLFDTFRRMTVARDNRRTLMALLIVGYATTWALFGVVAHGFDAALHLVADKVPSLLVNGWLIGAAIVALAGLYQFSSLKHRCLDKCRSPLMFIAEHWRGKSARRESFALGISHGAFCVGCCWALMLLMFAVGTGSVGWMLALGAIMSAEKNFRWGRSIGKPLGVALLAWSAWIVVQHARIV
ncbi:putative metal-binding membrane protein [Paraburkholderia sp. JPY171]|nr:putative metal-binding membrane protein [Paraburkholderia atlantica]